MENKVKIAQNSDDVYTILQLCLSVLKALDAKVNKNTKSIEGLLTIWKSRTAKSESTISKDLEEAVKLYESGRHFDRRKSSERRINALTIDAEGGKRVTTRRKG